MDIDDDYKSKLYRSKADLLIPRCESALREVLKGYTYPGVEEKIVRILTDIDELKELANA